MSDCLHGHLVHKLEERTTYCYDCGRKVGDILTELQAENAKLKAVVDAAKELLILPMIDGTEYWEAEKALEQAIKEVSDE